MATRHYHSDWPAISSLSSYIDTTLTGSIRPGTNSYPTDGPTAIRAIFNDSYVSFESVNFTFQAIAKSITLRIREYGQPEFDEYKQPVTGVAWENATCIDVRWSLLTLPATTTGLTVLLLVAVILKTEVDEVNLKVRSTKLSQSYIFDYESSHPSRRSNYVLPYHVKIHKAGKSVNQSRSKGGKDRD